MNIGIGALAALASGLCLGLIVAPETIAANLLLVGFLGVGIGLAGALLVALQFVTKAGWSVALRRVPEAMIAVLPVGGIILLLTLLLAPGLYPWTSPDEHLHGEFKQAWLQRPFFLVRALLYLLCWLVPAWLLVRHSRRQDVDGDPRHTNALMRLSPLFLVMFGATFWLASYDWIMSREPGWFSTIYGVYNFAGLFTSGLAVTILLTLWLEKRGPLRGVVTEKHVHDLGKLLFAMSTFWAYLWYCQYMLIWYVNNPEETTHYLNRLDDWQVPFFYGNVVLNWGVPFFVLLTQAAKKSRKTLANVCVVVLLGRWLDLDLMILPEYGGVLGGMAALALTAGLLGLYLLAFSRSLRSAAIVPIRDPYLVESLPGRSPEVLEYPGKANT